MSEIRANTVSDAAGTGPATLTGQSAAKAWANLNGTGTIALRDSFNVSSVADNGTGNYTFTFANALSDANYGAKGSVGGSWSPAANNLIQIIFPSANYVAGSIKAFTAYSDINGIGQAFDVGIATLAVDGDLA